MAAEVAISNAVQLLGDLLIQNVKSLRYRSVVGKVRSLKDELKRMQSFLKDANKEQAEDERVRNWISEIRKAAQDAQDTIERFRLNLENRGGLLNNITGFMKRGSYFDQIREEIESIQARLDAIGKSRERYGIKDLGEAAESAWRFEIESRRRLAPWQKDEHLVGMEEDVKKLLRDSILDEEKKGLSIAVIYGMGGIGKSTLARTIYNHPDVVSGGFECRGWVVVSSEFTPQETIKQLILQLPSSEEDRKKLRDEIVGLEVSSKDELYVKEKLQEMLYRQLDGKRYVIVLDDVWEKEHLESLMSSFPNQQDKTSRLLVTSRSKITTKYGQYEHQMKSLDHDKSWELFLKKAFIDSTNGKCPEELESIGRQISKKCDGLPLAISVVGGLLMETQTKSGWEQVLNEINFYLGRPESSVSAILELSYQNLSPQLKSCFLYLAFFKEDATIPAKRLVNMWVGQGLIQQEGSRRDDEIARGYLNELINRSMLQIEGLTIDARVKACRLHDLLHKLCLRKAKEEIGLEILKEKEGSSSESSDKPLHRVVYGKNLGTSSRNQNKRLRSLFLLRNVNGDDGNVHMTSPPHYWESFQLLKMLDFDGFEFQRLPHSFQLLIGLKNLRIYRHPSNRHNVLELPSWLNDLKNLEVLDVENECVMFPSVALKMERLRHFHVHSAYGSKAMKIRNWNNIESLKGVRLEDWVKCSLRLMDGCPLREVGIYMNRNEGNHELRRGRESLERMQNLVELHLHFDLSFEINTEIIPHLNSLTKLKLTGRMSKCPAAKVFPPNLSHLTLENAKLVDDPMTELGKLPKLQYLKLCKNAYEQRRIKVVRDGFPCLEILSLQNLYRLKGIDIEQGGMPRLKQLRTRHCPAFEIKNLQEHATSSAKTDEVKTAMENGVLTLTIRRR